MEGVNEEISWPSMKYGAVEESSQAMKMRARVINACLQSPELADAPYVGGSQQVQTQYRLQAGTCPISPE
jgi:hypothetical protein